MSALDSYVHSVVLDRSVDILLGRIPSTSESKFDLPFHSFAALLASKDALDRELLARAQLASRLGRETFQSPEKIASALAAVAIPRVWSTAFPDAATTKQELNLIVGRRNRIVHQCDGDPLSPGSPVPISSGDALDAIAHITRVVETIDPYCNGSKVSSGRATKPS